MTSTLARAQGSTAAVRWPGSSLRSQIIILTERSLTAVIRDPQIVLFGLLQPVVMLFLFTQVFANLGSTPHFPHGISYVDYLVPAILVDNAVQSSLQSGVGLVEDLKNGVVLRLRSLPIEPASMLVARSVSDLTRGAVQVIVILVLASTMLGYSPDGGFTGMVGSLLISLMVGGALGWVFLAFGTWLRRAEPMQNISFIALFPLMFASSAYVPIADLPTWLQIVAKVNPLTYALDATRSIALGFGDTSAVLPAILICGLLTLGGIIFAILGFRRPL
ncbi:ABC transporter permease [Amycolatopsis sp. H20-H5]|uniref:ABC transporter permease n=1 Tax=Amycolatopsis sp. H20-H5 TaxID=3046309 RepID=UPI002DBAEAAF|nr:ABC transporter permease [Amycolatopsis sp. H20-H5]MEC3979333.1 ABC transporter permease [Amycolatopsis sp. H20-H5]